VTLLYRTLQSTLVRRAWAMAAASNFPFKIAAKPLQIETWLLLTACKNSRDRLIEPYHASPTPYDVQFSHNTSNWHSKVHDYSSMSLKANDFYVISKSLCDFLLVQYNFGPISYRFLRYGDLSVEKRTFFLPRLCSTPNFKMLLLH